MITDVPILRLILHPCSTVWVIIKLERIRDFYCIRLFPSRVGSLGAYLRRVSSLSVFRRGKSFQIRWPERWNRLLLTFLCSISVFRANFRKSIHDLPSTSRHGCDHLTPVRVSLELILWMLILCRSKVFSLRDVRQYGDSFVSWQRWGRSVSHSLR